MEENKTMNSREQPEWTPAPMEYRIMAQINAEQDTIVRIIRDCNGMDEDGLRCVGCVMRNICEPGTHIEDYFEFNELKSRVKEVKAMLKALDTAAKEAKKA